jgi:hypothetical protein
MSQAPRSLDRPALPRPSALARRLATRRLRALGRGAGLLLLAGALGCAEAEEAELEGETAALTAEADGPQEITESLANARGLCVRRTPTVTVSPTASRPVAPGTAVTFTVTVTNRDVKVLGSCKNADFSIGVLLSGGPIRAAASPTRLPPIPPGSSRQFRLDVRSSSAVAAGNHAIPFEVVHGLQPTLKTKGSATYVVERIAPPPPPPDRDGDGVPDAQDACPDTAGVATTDPATNGCPATPPPPPPCDVVTNRELIMTDLSVVNDATRTRGSGAWTFKKLMEDMAPTAAQAPAMVEAMLNTWLAPQTINGFVVPARAAMSTLVLDRWPRVNGQLDLSRAPLRLLAIVNRPDLRNLAAGKAGEGRFVFGVLDGPTDPNDPAAGNPTQFTLILEYDLPAQTEADVQRWANDWHALGALPFPSAQYNAALEAITTGFAGRNAAPGRPNGSALSQLRTNEIALSSPWELREFVLSPTTGLLVPATVKLTPDLAFDNSAALGRFINANEAAILTETHDVPALFEGAPFVAGSSLNNLTAFRAVGVTNPEARHKFSLNTCSGCHGTEETGTPFLHVNPRTSTQAATLSGFMTGITRNDPVNGQSRTFNDLERRRVDLRAIVCPTPATAPAARALGLASATPAVSLRKGIGRVH